MAKASELVTGHLVPNQSTSNNEIEKVVTIEGGGSVPTLLVSQREG